MSKTKKQLVRYLLIGLVAAAALFSKSSGAATFDPVALSTDLAYGGAYEATAAVAVVHFTGSQTVPNGMMLGGIPWTLRCMSFDVVFSLNDAPLPPVTSASVCYPTQTTVYGGKTLMMMHDALGFVGGLQPSPTNLYLITFLNSAFDWTNQRYFYFAGNVTAQVTDLNPGAEGDHDLVVSQNLGAFNLGITTGSVISASTCLNSFCLGSFSGGNGP